MVSRRAAVLAAMLAAASGTFLYSRIAGGSTPDFAELAESPVKVQTFTTYNGLKATTASAEFKTIPGFERVLLCKPASGVSATLSLELSGGPVKVRIRELTRGGKSTSLHPQAVRFDPGESEGTAFSYTFTAERPDLGIGPWVVQWRAASPEAAALRNGTVRFLYGQKRPATCF